jgi:hypothetical protein
MFSQLIERAAAGIALGFADEIGFGQFANAVLNIRDVSSIGEMLDLGDALWAFPKPDRM